MIPEVLKDGALVLTPFDVCENTKGFDYLCDLATVYKYNNFQTKKQLLEIFKSHEYVIWAVEDAGTPYGVIFLVRDASLDTWFIHAYTNPGKANSDLSKRAAVLVIDFFFKNSGAAALAACPNIKNKPLVSLCQTLGFEKKGTLGDFLVMGITKTLWGKRG